MIRSTAALKEQFNCSPLTSVQKAAFLFFLALVWIILGEKAGCSQALSVVITDALTCQSRNITGELMIVVFQVIATMCLLSPVSHNTRLREEECRWSR